MALFRFGRSGAPSSDEAEKAADTAAEPVGKPGFLDRLRAGLAKTAKVLSTDVRDLFKREGRLVDDEFLAELRAALVKTDMGPGAAEAIVADVRERLRARVVEPEVSGVEQVDSADGESAVAAVESEADAAGAAVQAVQCQQQEREVQPGLRRVVHL